MFRLLIIVGISILLSSKQTHAQDLTQYLWKNRVVLVITNDVNSTKYTSQLLELKRDPKGFKERQLLVFQITPEAYKTGLFKDSNWGKSKRLYKEYKRTYTPLEVILIGLDGGVKARRTGIFKLKDLFAIIDGMPMRRAELNTKNK